MTNFNGGKYTRIGLAALLVFWMMLCVNALAEDYPESAHPYANNSDLTWSYVHPTEVNSLKLTFSSETELEDGEDYLYIAGSDGVERGYTGTTLKGRTITVSGSSVTLRLVSNEDTTAYGFGITNITAVPISAGNIEAGTTGTVSYELNLSTKTLTIFGNGHMASYTATSSAPWGMWKYYIEKIVVEEGVLSIGSYCFADLSYVSEVSIASTVQSIKNYAFENISDSVVAYGVTGDCTWHLSGSTIKISGTGAMADYDYGSKMSPWQWLESRITSIKIESGVTHVGDYAFYNVGNTYCALTLPEGLASIGNGSFYGVLLKTVSFPSTLVEIGASAFENVRYLSSVVLPDGLQTLGKNAFYGSYSGANTSLTSVSIPASLVNWGEYAFAGHNNLSSVTLEPGLTKIGEGAFKLCIGLTTISFPDSIVEIGDEAFCDCKNLVYTLPRYVERIGSYAFYVNYNSVMPSITLPSTIQSTGFNAFPQYYISGGTYLDFQIYTSGGVSGNYTWNISNGILKLTGSGPMEDYSLESGAPWSCMSDSITGVSLDSRITTIGNAAFAQLSFDSLTIPSGVTSIGEYAFYSASFPGVVLLSTLRTIGAFAFYNTSAASITIAEGVTTIGDRAFYITGSTGNLSTLAIPQSVTEIGGDIVNYSFTTVTSGLWYQGVLGSDITWQMRGGTIHLNGSGSMPAFEHESDSRYNYDHVDSPWWYIRHTICGAVIGEGITSVSNAAFYKCNNLTSVSLPSTLVSIGAEAFEQTALASVDVPAGVTSIGGWAFGDTNLTHFTYPAGVTNLTGLSSCSLLETVTIPENSSITSIGYNAFSGCASLRSISLPNAITEIESYAFNGCSSLSFVKLPENLTYIDNYAFADCSALSSLELPESLTHISAYAFKGCTSLASIDIPDSVGTLEKYCFDGCTSLASVSLPASLSSVPEYGFRGCSALARIEIPFGVSQIEQYAFSACTGLAQIVLPDTITAINAYAFGNCTSVSELGIPASVTTIGSNAFGGLTALKSIVFEGQAPSSIASTAFKSVTADVTYIPYESWTGKIQNYGGTLTWIKVNGSCGSDALWHLEADTVLCLSGSGQVTESGWAEHCANVTTLVVGADVSGIQLALADTLPNLQQIIFEGAAPFVAENAFAGLDLQAYCMHGKEGWTADAKLAYGGTVLWNVACSRSGAAATVGTAEYQAEIPASCTENGTAAHWLCSCGMLFDDEELLNAVSAEAVVLPALGHSYGEPVFDWAEDGSSCGVTFTCAVCEDVQTPETTIASERIKEPDCVNPGETQYTATVTFGEEEVPDPEDPESTIVQARVYTDQLVLADIPALGHTEVTIPGIAPTCTEAGMQDYIFCEICDAELQTADEIPALGHTETVTLEALEPTCTEQGHTEEISCSVCFEVLTASEEVPALGHTEFVSAEAIAPDCVNTGLTEEISCSVCSEVLTPAEIVPALGHTPETDAGAAADCVNTGLTEGSHCAVCGEILVAQEVVPALGHTPETDPAVAPTDRETGLTEGSHCSVCGEILTAQETVPANFDWDGDTVTAYNGTAADVILPADAAALGDTLFKNNTSITSVRMPDSVTSIGTQTFYGCTNLTDIWLPENLSGIGMRTFYNVSARIHVSAESPVAVALSYCSVPFTTEDGYTLRYRVTSATAAPSVVWLIAYNREAESVVLPEAINNVPLTQIHANAFAACTSLKEILIPDSVTSIADDAFAGCTDTPVIRSSAEAYAKTWAEANGFTWELYAPVAEHAAVTDPAVPATHVTTGLTEGSHCSLCGAILTAQEVIPVVEVPQLKLPAALKEIGEEAFLNTSAVCIILPDGCETIASGAFRNGVALRFVEIPASVTQIADDAFENCPKDLIFVTSEGSCASEFAQKNGFPCVFLP